MSRHIARGKVADSGAQDFQIDTHGNVAAESARV